MPQNDRHSPAENIVPLRSLTRPPPRLALETARAQPPSPVLFESWVVARDQAAVALLGGTRCLVVTGPAGTGKTVLLEHVARILRAAGRTVIVQQAIADPAPPEHGVTLFVDEADRLSKPRVQQLLKDAAGTVVLVGLDPLASRIGARTAHLALGRLDQVEAQHYISGWLALNGRTPAELDSQAVRTLLELSDGVPRLLSTLLAAGSWLARSSNEPVIGALHIREAAELRSVLGPAPAEALPSAPRPARRTGMAVPLLLGCAVLAGAAAALVPQVFPAETGRAMAMAAPFVERAGRWLRAEPPLAPPSPVKAAAKPSLPHIIEPALASEPAAVESPRVFEPAQPAAEPPAPVPPAAPRQAEAAAPLLASLASPPVALPVAAAAPPLAVETIQFLLRRGREMLALDDVSAARLLFLRAAEGGSPEAMVELGRTYDPALRSNLSSPGLSDRAEALRWYRRAAEKGDGAARAFLPKP